MTDWLQTAKDRDQRGLEDGELWVIAAALIAVAEELATINARPSIVINIPATDVTGDAATAVANAITRLGRP